MSRIPAEPGRRRRSAPRHRGPRSRRGTALLLLSGLVLASLGAIRGVDRAEAGPAALDAAHRFGAPIWSGDLRGNVTTIGNVVTTCRPDAGADPMFPGYEGTCQQVLDGTIGGDDAAGGPRFPANNEFDLVYVDVDGDAATHNSSSARLNLDPDAEIVWAGLHWHGLLEATQDGRAHPRWRAPVDPAARSTVSVRGPDGVPRSVIADDHWDNRAMSDDGSGHHSYAAYADVTELVRSGGAGFWTVGDVQTCTGPALALGCIGAWSLSVVYAAEDEPARNVNVWHGWAMAHLGTGGVLRFDANGIVPPPAGGDAEVGIVAADGDRGRGPEAVQYRTASRPGWTPLTSPTRPLHPDDPDEFFNSTIDIFGEPRGDRDARPNHRANLNLDIALIGGIPIEGGDDGVEFRIDTTTRRDAIYAQVVHTSIPLFEPEIEIVKTASLDIADPGDLITWTLEVTNVGIEPIREARVEDPLPPELEYVPGSIRYDDGGPADLLGAKSDEADDEAVWSAEDRRLAFNLGAGATAGSGGTMGTAGAADGSDRIVIRFDTIWRGEAGAEVVNEATAMGSGRELAEDPFGPITTRDVDDDRVIGRLLPLLVQDKTVDEDTARPGDTRTFTLDVRNRGEGEAAAGGRVVDRLPDGVTFVDATGGGVHDPAERTITWSDLPLLAPGAVWSAEVTVTIDSGVWDAELSNRMRLSPPDDDPVEVANPCDDDPDWSCAEIRTPRAGWSQDKTLAPDVPEVVEAGEEVAFDLHVVNTGEVAGSPTVVDQLPADLRFVSADHDGDHDPETNRITWAELPEIGAGEELALRVVALVDPDPASADPPVGPIVNRLRLQPPEDHPDPEVGHACDDDPVWSCAEVRTPEPVDPPPTTQPAGPVDAPPARSSAPPPTAVSRPAPGPLPRTGTDPIGTVMVGLGVFGVGWSLVLLSRRRRIATA